MYCSKCGAKLEDGFVFCSNCGNKVAVDSNNDVNYTGSSPNYSAPQNQQSTVGESKAGIGVLMALFLGIIGLIIGVLIYPYRTEARRTFVKGFWITYAVVLSIGAMSLLGVFATAGCLLV
ncbi:MAG: zinc ribbon domain-containing protein [Clostridia bacterium]|nr:zinc ribbon domain-containing protein [Clostridia bacterium]